MDLSFLNSPFFENHPRPTTRRQFLAHGLVGLSGALLAPTIFGMAKALADETGPSGAFLPLLVIDCAGGAAFPGNFLVGKRGGPNDLLKNYSSLGWNARAASAVDDRFGLPMAARGTSKILEGMLATMSVDAQKRFKMGSLLHFAQDDSSSNPLSIIGLASQAGAVGSKIRRALGSRPTESGGNSALVIDAPDLKPVSVNTYDDILNAVGLGAALTQLPRSVQSKLVKSTRDLSQLQIARLKDYQSADQLEKLLNQSFSDIVANIESSDSPDPRTNASIAEIFQIRPSDSPSDRNVISASIVMNVLNGAAPAGSITIDGCDYHTGSSQEGDAKDLEIGTLMGRAVESAHRLKTPLMIQLITDGGVYADPGTRNWRGDSGDRSMSVIGLYGTPRYVDKKSSIQIGAYTDGEGVDRDTLIGSKAALGGYAAFANYLSACGKIGLFDEVSPRVFGSNRELESVLIFG